jgi:hypothetical protein
MVVSCLLSVVCCLFGLLVYWFIGLLVYWFIGLLVYWFIVFGSGIGWGGIKREKG